MQTTIEDAVAVALNGVRLAREQMVRLQAVDYHQAQAAFETLMDMETWLTSLVEQPES